MRISAAILLLASSIQAADWISLKSADIEVISDAEQKTARQILDRLLQIQRLLPGRRNPAPIPLKVFLFSSARDYRAVAPDPKTSGFYQSGFEGDFIATYAGAPALPRVAMHEYVHFALNERRANQRPPWLEEGLAEYYSNASFTGNSVRLGNPIPEHLALLARERWLTPEQMNTPRQDLLFYAQSWAVVHLTMTQPELSSLDENLLRELQRYIRKMPTRTIKISPLQESGITAERVDALNALLLRAEIALATQHADLARALYEQASREYPDSPKVAGAVAFQKAVLEGDQAALERAVELNPKLGEAQLLLGERATDRGDLESAIRYLEQAVDLLPRKSNAWYALAFAQQKRGDAEAARVSLEQALRTATAPEQFAMARALLESLQ